MIPKHFRATIRRTDCPDAKPDWADEANRRKWSVDKLAIFLRRRYGPTVEATVDADGVRFLVTGSVVRRL